jgi:hypothetical protein
MQRAHKLVCGELILDIPGFLSAFYFLSLLSPNLLYPEVNIMNSNLQTKGRGRNLGRMLWTHDDTCYFTPLQLMLELSVRNTTVASNNIL